MDAGQQVDEVALYDSTLTLSTIATMAITPDPASKEESPSSTEAAVPVPGPSAFHESSQFRHWRYSREQLYSLRQELNEKSREVTERNMNAERVG